MMSSVSTTSMAYSGSVSQAPARAPLPADIPAASPLHKSITQVLLDSPQASGLGAKVARLWTAFVAWIKSPAAGSAKHLQRAITACREGTLLPDVARDRVFQAFHQALEKRLEACYADGMFHQYDKEGNDYPVAIDRVLRKDLAKQLLTREGILTQSCRKALFEKVDQTYQRSWGESGAVVAAAGASLLGSMALSKGWLNVSQKSPWLGKSAAGLVNFAVPIGMMLGLDKMGQILARNQDHLAAQGLSWFNWGQQTYYAGQVANQVLWKQEKALSACYFNEVMMLSSLAGTIASGIQTISPFTTLNQVVGIGAGLIQGGSFLGFMGYHGISKLLSGWAGPQPPTGPHCGLKRPAVTGIASYDNGLFGPDSLTQCAVLKPEKVYGLGTWFAKKWPQWLASVLTLGLSANIAYDLRSFQLLDGVDINLS